MVVAPTHHTHRRTHTPSVFMYRVATPRRPYRQDARKNKAHQFADHAPLPDFISLSIRIPMSPYYVEVVHGSKGLSARRVATERYIAHCVGALRGRLAAEGLA